MGTIKAVVTDLDNTLYPWVDYIVPCLEAMVASLEQTTQLPRIAIIQALKKVYERHGSNEYPFAIQESELFEPYEGDADSFLELVVKPAQRAFREMRRRYLAPYPGVPETLRALRQGGIKVVGLTDAPRNPVEVRLKHLALDELLDAVYTLPGYPLPEVIDPKIRARDEAGGYRARCAVKEVPKEFEKPDPRGLGSVIADLGVAPGEAIFIGDNIKKDMPVAQAAGAVGVWAEYGTYVSREYRERLNVISAKSVTRRHVSDQSDPAQARWPLAVSSFAQLADVIDGARWVKAG